MSDDKLRSQVEDELRWDPRVDGAAVSILADDGKVTLRGTVGTFREKRAAEKAARRVHGVTSVANQLQVRFLTGKKRHDADVRADVLQALMLDSLVPPTIDVRVGDGFVVLTGTADWQYQRAEAERVAANIVGVLNVLDEVTLRPRPNAGDVMDRISDAFRRNAGIDADRLAVSTSDGRVKVKGPVSSWAEHDEALAAAWAAPGVSYVDDHIHVEH